MFIVENLASTRNFMDRGAWQATAHGVTKVIHNYMTEQEKSKKKETTAPPHTHTHTHSHHLEAVSVNILVSTLLKHS